VSVLSYLIIVSKKFFVLLFPRADIYGILVLLVINSEFLFPLIVRRGFVIPQASPFSRTGHSELTIISTFSSRKHEKWTRMTFPLLWKSKSHGSSIFSPHSSKYMIWCFSGLLSFCCSFKELHSNIFKKSWNAKTPNFQHRPVFSLSFVACVL